MRKKSNWLLWFIFGLTTYHITQKMLSKFGKCFECNRYFMWKKMVDSYDGIYYCQECNDKLENYAKEK